MSQRIIRGIFLLLSSYFVLWACAPIPNLISPIPMANPTVPSEGLPLPTEHRGEEREIGFGLAVTQAFDPSWGYTVFEYSADSDFWFIKHKTPKLDIGMTVFAGKSSYFGVGMITRHWFVDNDRRHIGLGLQGGWLWAGIDLPIAWRLSQRLWMFTAPAIKISALNVFYIPVGLSVQTDGNLVLSTQLNLSATEANLNALGYTIGGPSLTLGVSVAKRF